MNKINELRKVKARTVDTKTRNAIVNDTASKSLNKQIGELHNQYNKLSNAKRNEFHSICDLLLDNYE